MNKKILIAGDIHAQWEDLNEAIDDEYHKIKMIISCGDFGWWPHFHGTKNKLVYGEFNQFGINNRGLPIYWCDGNHENFDSIDDYVSKNIFNFAGENIFYQPRGSVITLDDERNIMFFGGGLSIDKHHRKIGYSWWPQEIPNNDDINRALDNLEKYKIDIMISHTGPEVFIDQLNPALDKLNDPTVKIMNMLLERASPKQWFFGHFHQYMTGHDMGCDWTCLNRMDRINGYVLID